MPDTLRDAWKRAEAAWDEPKHHDEILRLTAQHNVYAWTAGRYRTHKGDPVAEKAIERMQRALFATLSASASPRAGASGPQPYRSAMGILGLLLVVLVVGVVYAVVFYKSPSRRRPATEPAVPAQTAPR